jgi:hypothetical protein
MRGFRHAAPGAIDHTHGAQQALDPRGGGGAGGWCRQVRVLDPVVPFAWYSSANRLCRDGYCARPQHRQPRRSAAAYEPLCPAVAAALPDVVT